MDPNQIALVQQSFVKVAPLAEAVADLFYARLFELDQGLKPLFRASDMRQQGRMLMKMLTITVQGLSRLDTIVPADDYPSGAEAGVLDHLDRQFAADLAAALPGYRAGLDGLDTAARAAHGRPFAALRPDDRGREVTYADVGRDHLRNHRLARYPHRSSPDHEGNPRVFRTSAHIAATVSGPSARIIASSSAAQRVAYSSSVSFGSAP